MSTQTRHPCTLFHIMLCEVGVTERLIFAPQFKQWAWGALGAHLCSIQCDGIGGYQVVTKETHPETQQIKN